MAKGGRRTPNDKTPVVAGPGKFSRRSDGRQPIDVPNVGDSTDLKHGDRQRLEASQRIAAVPRSPSPRVQAPAVTPGSPAPSGGGSEQLPEFLFGGESTRPDEPITEGMPFGPGAGPEALQQMPEPDDDKEFVLHMLAGPPFNNDRVAQMYRDLQAERRPVPIEPMDLAEPVVEEIAEEAPELAATDLSTEEEVAVEGDEEELSVETPEAAIPEEGGEPSPLATSPQG